MQKARPRGCLVSLRQVRLKPDTTDMGFVFDASRLAKRLEASAFFHLLRGGRWTYRLVRPPAPIAGVREGGNSHETLAPDGRDGRDRPRHARHHSRSRCGSAAAGRNARHAAGRLQRSASAKRVPAGDPQTRRSVDRLHRPPRGQSAQPPDGETREQRHFDSRCHRSEAAQVSGARSGRVGTG